MQAEKLSFCDLPELFAIRRGRFSVARDAICAVAAFLFMLPRMTSLTMLGQQVVREDGVEVEDRKAVEAYLIRCADQKLDRVLVV